MTNPTEHLNYNLLQTTRAGPGGHGSMAKVRVAPYTAVLLH